MEEERAYIEWLKGQKSRETKPAEEMVGFLSLICRIAISTDSYQWFGLQTRQSINPANCIDLRPQTSLSTNLLMSTFWLLDLKGSVEKGR